MNNPTNQFIMLLEVLTNFPFFLPLLVVIYFLWKNMTHDKFIQDMVWELRNQGVEIITQAQAQMAYSSSCPTYVTSSNVEFIESPPEDVSVRNFNPHFAPAEPEGGWPDEKLKELYPKEDPMDPIWPKPKTVEAVGLELTPIFKDW